MDKMREEFEAWFEANHKTENASFNFAIGEAMWDAWKASREALCVELQEREVAGKYTDDFEEGHESGFNDALSDCKVAIKKAWVSYK